MSKEHLSYLKQLKEAGEVACQAAYRRRNRSLKGACANWADLHCVGAEYRLDDFGREYYAVDIEEAAPGCESDPLAKFIADKLSEMGHANVYVRTEW